MVRDFTRRRFLAKIGPTFGLPWLTGCTGSNAHKQTITFEHQVSDARTAKATQSADSDYQLIDDGVHWHSPPVSFKVGILTKPNNVDVSSAKSAINAAMESWNSVSGAVSVFESPTYDVGLEKTLPGNRVNEIVWGSLPSNVVGRGRIEFARENNRLLELDIILNKELPWTTSPSGQSAYGIQNIVTHELGHCGLRDVTDAPEETMFHATQKGETKKRTLESGDAEGWRQIY